MTKSKIEWTDKTWNPVTGCTKVSQGCKNCYAERMYERFHGHGSFKNVRCHNERLTIPTKWPQPSMVFVNSMSDLFHENVPFEFIDSVFSVMSDVRRHTYQVLTKRPERMYEFYLWKRQRFGNTWRPSDNVWLGVSVEDQKAADERIPFLLKCPATVTFLSCEPLLGHVDISSFKSPERYFCNKCGFNGYTNSPLRKHPGCNYAAYPVRNNDINWVIVGGESGPHARPMHPDWARSLRDQCKARDIAFFFKQWGEWAFEWAYDMPSLMKKTTFVDHNNVSYEMFKTGKKIAGRILDYDDHNQFPIVMNATVRPLDGKVIDRLPG